MFEPGVPDVDAPGDAGEAMRRLLAVFARAEFQAPVEAITGLVALLVEDWTDAASRDDVAKLAAAAERLDATVRRLLDPTTMQGLVDGGDAATASSHLRHELRTPITAILGYGELLGEEIGDGPDAAGTAGQAGTLTDILDAARRLLDQIDAMVDFLRLNHEGRVEEARQLLDQDAGLQEPMEAIRSVLKEQGQTGPRAIGRVLVVDDNASTLDLLSRRLRRDGHEVTSCDNGEGALELLAGTDYDLVLLDLLMPGLSGIEVLRRIKATPATAGLPVIIVSALGEIESAVHCIEAGADDYLTKPINPVLLRARMTASLERKFLRDRDEATTRELRAEQERSEKLLLNVLPRSVLDRFRAGESVIADRFASATILFSDIVDFTQTTATLPPDAVLDLLNGIFSRFDRLTAEHGLEKIKTIGDAYMAAGGLPGACPDHARRAVAMALRMPAAVAEASRARGQDLRIRIGLHTGPVAAGIIGKDKFIYDVWGDTVNVASRMESLGEAGRVHITGETLAALDGCYAVEPRAPVNVKGRGIMSTFFLVP
ncbi:adenylate/guanylate cyclase domain-containing protein [Lichenibacterium ramalinae]|uniref:histidine kinase n=1 Tax=Lichenibacterium ramalinae TaxID=2316527 RepID=A0A4Q2RFE1_9HYPH|nr:adenylate/guanylate cyclase domain-containing protein [Lichenibacterium ramalinae]RYB05060.1 response regulator [Lichenibacterium ramalinae]